MSCTLGASAKIYALRVDKTYTDMVKVLSGKFNEIDMEEADEEENEEGEFDEVAKKKLRKDNDSSDEENEDKDDNFNYTAVKFERLYC